ncbi:hypothetical protein ACVI1J_006624 [Bradyrhizobium diazoefficiens]
MALHSFSAFSALQILKGAPLIGSLLVGAGCAAYATIFLTSAHVDHYRYKMTVVVRANDNEVSKSGVIGVERSWSRDWLLRWRHHTKVDGEAIFIDLGRDPEGRPKNIAITMLSRTKDGQGAADRWPYWGKSVRGTVKLGPAHYRWWETAFCDACDPAKQEVVRQNEEDALPITGSTELPPEHYPALAEFVNTRPPYDISSPAAAILHVEQRTQLLPGQPLVQTIIVEPTDLPVTRGLAQRFSWLADVRAPAPPSLAGFGRAAFIRDND